MDVGDLAESDSFPLFRDKEHPQARNPNPMVLWCEKLVQHKFDHALYALVQEWLFSGT